MAQVLQDKVAIVTGGGRGLGQAIALRYLEEGAKLFLPDISLERAESVVNEIRAKGGEAVAVETDISDENATQKMAEKVMQQYGRVDILVNNAAVYYGLNTTPWDAWAVEEWDRIFAVNVRGTWLCCKAIAPIMKKQSKGKIINIASNIAKVPAGQFLLPYSLSKAALYTLTQALARNLGPSGINVNAIAPGYFASEASLAQKDSDETFKMTLALQVIQKRQQPFDLTGTAVFLASEDSDFISGQTLSVDGGIVML